jgi:hypothetical protein
VDLEDDKGLPRRILVGEFVLVWSLSILVLKQISKMDIGTYSGGSLSMDSVHEFRFCRIIKHGARGQL